jgi:nicotinate-nucleotide pyrophosphorylase (carboxylating)
MTPTPADLNTCTLDELFDRLVRGAWLDALIEQAHAEDMTDRGDVTSSLTIAADAEGAAVMRARASGVLAGLPLLRLVAGRYDSKLTVTPQANDGDALDAGQAVASIAGPLRAILAAERVMLNFICHLSGIATLTRRYVEAVAGTKARILDTRKTLPGYRHLAKYAVRCGGGLSHRMGLYDAVLIKDNHLASVAGEGIAERVAHAIVAARRQSPAPDFVEVEVDTPEQLAQVLTCDVDFILLDNMPPATLREAVGMRDAAGHRALLEASGCVNLQTVRSIAEAGVDRISIGALTHSAPALDLGLDLEA